MVLNPMATQRYHFDLFADYFQFYLQDETADGNLSESWTEAATDRMLAVAPGTLGIGTVRNMIVPVNVEVRDSAPEESLDEWDQVIECSMEVHSGRIVIAGCTDYFPAAARIAVTPGQYRARVYYGNMDTLSENGLAGDDRYSVVLWPAMFTEPVILKSRRAGGRR
jgi:hypothetical protein